MSDDFSNDPERLKQYAGVIHKENNRLQQQVERVLNTAKLDRNELELHKEELDVHALIEETAENFRFNQFAKGGKIQLDLEAVNTIINADEVHLTNILFNLIDNAVKYSEEPVKVELATINVSDFIEISIKDHGIGMRKEELKQIFDKFYRVPTGDRHDVKGFGLGLYYVKIIVEEHGGKIGVGSKIGQGSTFTLQFPTLVQSEVEVKHKIKRK